MCRKFYKILAIFLQTSNINSVLCEGNQRLTNRCHEMNKEYCKVSLEYLRNFFTNKQDFSSDFLESKMLK